MRHQHLPNRLSVRLVAATCTLGLALAIGTTTEAAEQKAQKKAEPAQKREFSFMGSKIGDSAEAFLATLNENIGNGNISYIGGKLTESMSMSGCNKKISLSGEASCTLLTVKIVGIPAKWVQYSFRDGKFDGVIVDIERTYFDDLRDIVSAKYGKPSQAFEKEYANGYGAKFKRRTFLWNFTNGVLDYSEMLGNDLSESGLIFESNKAGEARRNKRGQETEKAKNAL